MLKDSCVLNVRVLSMRLPLRVIVCRQRLLPAFACPSRADPVTGAAVPAFSSAIAN